MAEEPILKIEGLWKRFGHRTVVRNVSYSVGRAEIVGLLGRNGAGKTTTFRMTVGMLTPDQGRIILQGEDITDLPMYLRARRGLGYLSQEQSIFQRLTVEENILAILEMLDLSRAEQIDRLEKLIEEFGLHKVRRSIANTLSGGEKRRLEIARALTTRPQLMLLDEPFAGVDPIAVADIQKIILEMKQRNISVLITDHNVRETLNVTDHSYIIDDGQIISSGSRDQVINDPVVRKAYLGETFEIGRRVVAGKIVEDTPPTATISITTQSAPVQETPRSEPLPPVLSVPLKTSVKTPAMGTELPGTLRSAITSQLVPTMKHLAGQGQPAAATPAKVEPPKETPEMPVVAEKPADAAAKVLPPVTPVSEKPETEKEKPKKLDPSSRPFFGEAGSREVPIDFKPTRNKKRRKR